VTAVTADTSAHFKAVYTMLDAVMPFPVGDSEQLETVPSLSLYAIPGGLIEGTIGEPDVDVEMPFQVTCLSRRRDHAQWMQNDVRQLMLANIIAVPGRSVTRVTCDPSGVERDDRLGEREGQVFYTTDVFNLHTVPE
jgi:hypothetical protein